jgi:polysaccharide chain length determinant protein (PEP-CTERM system associated)
MDQTDPSNLAPYFDIIYRYRADQTRHFTLAPYFDIIYRHRLSSVCALAVGSALTLLAVTLLPSIYRSSTLVMIQPQEVPSAYVSAPVTGHIRDRLQALGQIALSRTRLKRIIAQFGLYDARRRRGASIEEIVEYMRRHIHVDVTEDPNNTPEKRTPSFTLSFEYSNAVTAQRVTAQLANLFIDEDLRQRRGQAAATTSFLNEQLAKASAALEDKGREIKIFKDRYQGSLPQDLEINLKMLGDLQIQFQKDNEALVALQQRHSQLQRDLAHAQEDQIAIISSTGQRSSASPEAALSLKETELAELQARNTELHPDVVRVKAEISALKSLIKSRINTDGVSSRSPMEEELSKEIDSTEVDQQRLQTELPGLKQKIDDYQRRITQTPAHEQQFASLTRDYNGLDTDYHKLLDKKLEAQISQNLEQREEGERFQVIDPANLPLEPEAPDRKALAIGGLLFSLSLAGGLPFALFFTDSSFKDPDELRRELAVAAVTAVPKLPEIEGTIAGRRAIYPSLAISFGSFLLGAGALWLYAQSF